MNVLKIAVQDLRDYLGADERGVKLLEKVVTIANDQRKRIQALEVNAIAAADHLERARALLVTTERELQLNRQEWEREKSAQLTASCREAALTAEINRLKNNLDPLDDSSEKDDAGLGKEARFYRRLFKEVRRRFRNMASLHPEGEPQGTNIRFVEDVVPSFSVNRFASLGMLVAIWAIVGMPLVVKTKRLMRDIPGLDKSDSKRFIIWSGYISGCFAKERSKILSESQREELEQKISDGRFGNIFRDGA